MHSNKQLATAGNSNRFLSLQAGRFFAALAVVLYHVHVTTSQPKYFGYLAVPEFAGGFSGVEFFFVLSGFVISSAHYKDLNCDNKLLVLTVFFWKRFARLYPALWVILFFLVPAMLFSRALQWNGPLSLGDIISAFLIIPASYENILPVEWTLRYEVIFYLVFGVFLVNRFAGIALFGLLCFSSIASFIYRGNGLVAFFVQPYPLLFVAGVLIGIAQHRFTLRLSGPAIVTGIAIFGWRLGVCALRPEQGGATFTDTICFGVGATIIVYGLVALELRRTMPVPAWLQYLGAASYAIYLVHFPVISVGTKIAMRFRHHQSLDLALMFVIAAAAVVSGAIYHELVEKRLNVFTRGLVRVEGVRHAGTSLK